MEEKYQRKCFKELIDKGYRLIHREYELVPGQSQYGKGDLLFKKKHTILVVEVKYIDFGSKDRNSKTVRTKRTKHRKKVKEQAILYCIALRIFHHKLNKAKFYPVVYTNEFGFQFFDEMTLEKAKKEVEQMRNMIGKPQLFWVLDRRVKILNGE